MSDIGQQLIAFVRAEAEATPAFVYQAIAETGGTSCKYVVDSRPSCIIGKALWEAGLIHAKLELNDSLNHMGFGLIVKNGALPGLDDLDEEEVTWLTTVQQFQDSASSWGRAIEAADAGEHLW